MLNSKIPEILQQYNIYVSDGMAYLLSIYYGYEPTYIPDDIKRRVNSTNIIALNDKNVLEWKVPLFESVDESFEWVATEYVTLFSTVNPGRGGYARESTIRMKKLFAEFPQYRKDDILDATRLYLSNTPSKYIRHPHYFIEKGVGSAKTRDILEWLDRMTLMRDNDENRTSITRKLQ